MNMTAILKIPENGFDFRLLRTFQNEAEVLVPQMPCEPQIMIIFVLHCMIKMTGLWQFQNLTFFWPGEIFEDIMRS